MPLQIRLLPLVLLSACSLSDSVGALNVHGKLPGNVVYKVFPYAVEVVDSLYAREKNAVGLDGKFETKIFFKNGGQWSVFGFHPFSRSTELDAFTLVVQDSSGAVFGKCYRVTDVCREGVCDIGSIDISSLNSCKRDSSKSP